MYSVDASCSHAAVMCWIMSDSFPHLLRSSLLPGCFKIYYYYYYLCVCACVCVCVCVYQGLLHAVSWITHNDAPQSIGLLRTSDHLVAVTSTWQHTTLTTDRHPFPRWNSNPQSQQASSRRRRLRPRDRWDWLILTLVYCIQLAAKRWPV